jgi:FdhE protein
MTRDGWLKKHPYLQGIAELQEMIECAATAASIPSAGVPLWSAYNGDFHFGVPLLLTSTVTVDLQPAEQALDRFLQRLAPKPLPGGLARQMGDLISDLKVAETRPPRAMNWLLIGDGFAPSHPGLFQYLGWTVMARYLRRLAGAFAQWRDEERWLRSYCPMCGAPPAMAQLVAAEQGRLRLLSCGRCATRWRYRRTGCPYCEVEDIHSWMVLTIEGEDALRIENCENCWGYLKTYIGEGSETLLLSDWTSVHLDVIACDHGFKRYAGSLYQM